MNAYCFKFVCKQSFNLKLSNRRFSSANDKIKIGFIGLGNMGKPMANNLIKHSFHLNIHDINQQNMEELGSLMRVKTFNEIDELTKSSDVIITMLPSCNEVKNVYLSEKGILNNAKPNLLAIDCSTINPFVTKEILTIANSKNIDFVDAPVSGGTVAAKNGSLTFMIGSSIILYPRVVDVLKMIGTNFIHCGEVGCGHSTKICNNILLAISMIGTSEVLNLGQRLGLDPVKLSSAINLSSGRCWSSEKYNPYPGIVESAPSSGNYNGGFGSHLMLKDLELAMNCFIQSKSSAFMGPLAHNLYKLHCQNEQNSTADFSSIIKLFKNK